MRLNRDGGKGESSLKKGLISREKGRKNKKAPPFTVLKQAASQLRSTEEPFF